MIRGNIYQANLDPTEGSEQSGTRPVVIVSRNGINRSSPVVVIVPLTKFVSKKKVYPSHCVVKANSNNGLKLDSIVKCEQIRAIAKSRLVNKLGSLSMEDLKNIDVALKTVLSLS